MVIVIRIGFYGVFIIMTIALYPHKPYSNNQGTYISVRYRAAGFQALVFRKQVLTPLAGKNSSMFCFVLEVAAGCQKPALQVVRKS